MDILRDLESNFFHYIDFFFNLKPTLDTNLQIRCDFRPTEWWVEY